MSISGSNVEVAHSNGDDLRGVDKSCHMGRGLATAPGGCEQQMELDEGARWRWIMKEGWWSERR